MLEDAAILLSLLFLITSLNIDAHNSSFFGYIIVYQRNYNANFHLNTMKINAIYHASTLQRQLTMWRTWRAHNRKQNRVNHRTPIHL